MSEVSQVWLTVLFMFLSVLIATGCRELKKVSKISVTFSIMISGVLFRVIGSYVGDLAAVVDFVKSINQTVFQFAAFPMIIFQGALSKNWHTMRKELVQISILASTHLLLTSIFNAFILKYVLGYRDFDTSELLLLGVVLCSTDNFAIDSILEEVVLPDDLETLMSGETMFNEAAVFVMFQILLNSSGGALNIAQAVGIAFRLTLGGLSLGVSYGVVMGFLFRRMQNDFFLVMNTFLVAVYSLFFTCEGTVVRFSGGFALVALGLFLSAYGKALIHLEILDQVNNILNILARNSESIVFLISGILIADISIYETNGLQSKDFISLAALFPLCHLTRGASLLLHYPLLKCFGPHFNWKEYTILALAGVKGIFSTTLALVLFTSDTLKNPRFQNVSAFLAIGSAGLTVATSGVIIKFFTKILGFGKIDEFQENLMLGVAKAIADVSEEKIKELQGDKNLNLVKWEEVILNYGPKSLVHRILKSVEQTSVSIFDLFQINRPFLHSQESEKTPLSQRFMVVEVRTRYLSALKGIYWESYQQGMCEGSTFLLLTESCNFCLDRQLEVMKDWEIVVSSAYSNQKVKWLTKASKISIIGRVFKKVYYELIYLACDAAQTFIKCHQMTEELLDKLEVDFDRNAFDEIIQEASNQIELAKKFLNLFILDCFPEILAETQTKRCCKGILYVQKKTINKIFNQGLIKSSEYETLKLSIESSLNSIVFKGSSPPVLREILINRFQEAKPAEIDFLLSKIQEIEVNPEETIFTENEIVKGAFLIIRGRVLESSSWINQELITGNILGVQHLLPENSFYYKSSAKAITPSVFAMIPKEIIEIPGFLLDLYQEATEEILLLNREKYDLQDVDEKLIIRVASASKVISLKKGKKFCFVDGALAVNGQPTKKKKRVFLRPNKKRRKIFEDCIFIVFPKDFSLAYSKKFSLGKCFERFCLKNINRYKGKENEKLDYYSLTRNQNDVTVLEASNQSLKFKRKKMHPDNKI
jgi:NhaP-type Na+/H+ or K+/H+ antiporter